MMDRIKLHEHVLFLLRKYIKVEIEHEANLQLLAVRFWDEK